MVLVLPAVKSRGQSFGEKLGSGLGEGLRQGIEMYQQHQKQKQTGEALRSVEQIYADPNLNEQQKLIASYRLLAGTNPDLAQQLAGNLSRLSSGQSRAEEFKAKIKQQEADKKAMHSFGEKLINDNPDNPFYQTIGNIYTSDLSPDIASRMVHDLVGVDPFRVQQQRRLQMDSVLKRYNQRIKEIDDEIKGYTLPNSRDKQAVDALRQQKAALQGERDQLLGFKALMDEEEGFEQGFDEDEDIEPDEDVEEGPKVRFDPNNAKHKAVAQKLYAQYKDKEKVRQILRKRFKGL